MRILVFILGTLLVSALAAPVPEAETPSDTRSDEEMVQMIKKLKDPHTYESLKEASEKLEILSFFGSIVRVVTISKLEAEERKDSDYNLEVLRAISVGSKVLYGLCTATLVEGAKPTAEQLTDLAKKLSKVARESPLIVRNLTTGPGTLMTNETIDLLKQIVQDTPLKVSGNSYLEIMKEKIPRLYVTANSIKNADRGIKAAIKTGDWERLPNGTEQEHEEVRNFVAEFIIDEIIAFLKSEEAAIEIFKNFGIVTDTLKTASSYESLQAFHNALARSKRLEAHSILIREIGKCAGQQLNPEERAQWHQHFGKLLQALKLLLADGVDSSKFPAAMKDFVENDAPVLEALVKKIGEAIESVQGKEQFGQCLISEDDRKVYKEALALSDPVFTDAQLSAIRQKNEKVYAFVHNLNGIVKVVRERQGLGAEADSFLKEMVTMPNSLLRIAEFFSPSQETLDKIASHTKAVVDKYNSLSVQARKELVDMFPYRTAINLALLE